MSVLVYTENWDGKFKKLSYELVSFGKKIAEMLGSNLSVVSIGNVKEDELKTLGNYGADKVFNINKDELSNLDNAAYASVLEQIAQKENAKVVVISNNNTGKGVAPRLSVKLKAGIASGVTKLPESTDPFIITKKAFSGKTFANIKINSDVKILTLAQNSFEIIETENKAIIENFEPQVDSPKTKIEDVQKVTGKIILTDAEIVISGGRGMKSSENWGPIEELAEILEGATACSRPVSDEGWRPHDEHTGQTGKIIAPNLYIAAGISGAIQHMAGVSSSKCIVAINTDKDAPIFSMADYGIVGDASKVLPELISAVKNIKS